MDITFPNISFGGGKVRPFRITYDGSGVTLPPHDQSCKPLRAPNQILQCNRRGDPRIPPEDNQMAVTSQSGLPVHLMAFCAAKKVKVRRPLLDRATNRVRHEQTTGSMTGPRRVETALEVADTRTKAKAIERCRDLVPHAQDIEPQPSFPECQRAEPAMEQRKQRIGEGTLKTARQPAFAMEGNECVPGRRKLLLSDHLSKVDRSMFSLEPQSRAPKPRPKVRAQRLDIRVP